MTTFDSAPITDATVQTFTAQMKAAGQTDEAIAATLAKHDIGAQPQSAPAPDQRPTLQPDLNASKHPRLSPSELERAADTLRRSWTGDPNVLRERLQAAGLNEVADTKDDPRTDVEQDFDRTLGVPASADEYELGDLMVNRAGLDIEGAAEVSTAVRTALHDMNVPKHMARTLGGAILDAVERSNAAHMVQNDARSNAEVAAACQVLGVSREELFSRVRQVTEKLTGDSKELMQHAVAIGHDRNLLVWLFRASELRTIRRGLEQHR
jgi:hypothetical protein